MKFTLSFDCDNAAFADDLEAAVAEVLRYVADRVEAPLAQTIRDRNGNTIGSFRLESA